jgi:hypothetical protein
VSLSNGEVPQHEGLEFEVEYQQYYCSQNERYNKYYVVGQSTEQKQFKHQ